MPGDAGITHTEDGLEIGEVADLVLRREIPPAAPRTRIDPRGVHADAVRALDVDVGAIADEERARGIGARGGQRPPEDVRARLAPADGVGHDHRGEEVQHAGGLENPMAVGV